MFTVSILDIHPVTFATVAGVINSSTSMVVLQKLLNDELCCSCISK